MKKGRGLKARKGGVGSVTYFEHKKKGVSADFNQYAYFNVWIF